jgi:hypothetical protein
MVFFAWITLIRTRRDFTSKTNNNLFCVQLKEYIRGNKFEETVNRRKTDNTIDKRKWTKGQTIIYKTLHRKLKIVQHEPRIKTGSELVCSRRLSSSTRSTRYVTLDTNPGIRHGWGKDQILITTNETYHVVISW